MTKQKLRELIAEYNSYVYAICASFVHDAQEAESLSQEVFLAIYTRAPDGIEGYIKSYLAKVAVNKCKDYLKSAYVRRVIPVGDESLSNISMRASPEEEYISREGYQKLADTIENLPEPYLEAAKMYFLQELNLDEISKRLGRNKKTVSTQITRARKKLREMIRGEPYE
ncbi:MAG: sigma-70 family RNA polymerase sigma factor [Firmicutes bacterium]|nr:sigma-70 family RNA polymerase sigma factor [Bacillota bacterium]